VLRGYPIPSWAQGPRRRKRGNPPRRMGSGVAGSRGGELKKKTAPAPPPRNPLVCVDDRICPYLSSGLIFGDLRCPVPPRGVLLMYIHAHGPPAHPDSVCVVLPPKTTQETTSRWAEQVQSDLLLMPKKQSLLSLTCSRSRVVSWPRKGQ
jgi:hypothetical protein